MCPDDNPSPSVDRPETRPQQPLPTRLVVAGVLVPCLGGLWLLPVLVAGKAILSLIIPAAILVTPGIGLLLRRRWARPLCVVNSCLFAIVPALVLFHSEALHWLQLAWLVVQPLVAAAAIVLLAMKGGDEALVGSARGARRATVIVVAILLVLLLLTFAVDDEGPSPFRIPSYPQRAP